MNLRPVLAYGALALAAVAVDQWVKRLVETGLAFQQKLELIPFLALYRTHNNGIAFSMFASFGDVGLIIVALVVIAVVLALASRTRPDQIFARIGFALVIGGAIGNLVDRATLGYVIDYILFHTPVWSFAIFNLADAFITIGAGFVLFQEFVDWRRDRLKSEAGAPPHR